MNASNLKNKPQPPVYKKDMDDGEYYDLQDKYTNDLFQFQNEQDEDLRRDMLKQDLEMGRAVNARMEEYYERFNS